MQHILYAIGMCDDLEHPYNKCYIGVTKDLKARWNQHKKSKYRIGHAIRKHNLTYENNMIIIQYGSKQECYLLESQYRPAGNMGLNEAPGGFGGYTAYSEERNKKISAQLKGRKVPWMHKIVESRKSYVGSNNPRAKKWVICDPQGIEHIIHGSIQTFCDNNDILFSALRYYRGNSVPQIENNRYGGYRSKNEDSLRKRIKTTGWSLKYIMEN